MAKLKLEDLGADIARAQDEGVANVGAIAEARARLFERSVPRVSSRSARRRRTALAIGLVAAAAALWLFVFRQSPPLTIAVGTSEPATANVGAWIAAPAAADLPLAFSDGTRIVLGAGGRARVTRVDADGADVILERGRAHTAVVHRAASRWTVIAGPFEVHVTGTEFDVAWDPATEELAVTLERGGVLVTGCAIEGGRRVNVGESIRALCKDSRSEIRTVSTLAVATAPASAQPSIEPVADASVTTLTALPHPASSTERAVASPASDDAGMALVGPEAGNGPTRAWRELALAGKYKEATDLALAADFARECERASAEDLLLLADAARFAGHVERAHEALVSLRRRFPSDPRAVVAAFQLGRLAFDQQHDYAKAVEWFDTYLREAPSGPLAREAAGRLVEAKDRAGDARGAREAARRYLEAHPTGPHAEIARAVVARSSADASSTR